MHSAHLKNQIEITDEHAALLAERSQNWRQLKRTVVAQERSILGVDQPILAPNGVRPRKRDNELRLKIEEERNIAAQMDKGRNNHLAKLEASERNIRLLNQCETNLDRQIEAEKEFFNAQLEKVEAELAFVSSLQAF
uniref:Uncharacterized protein n=1 Tax=Globodera rostochiensis TaxID=31243 RepID=A0A914IAT9_GLORO